MAPTPLLRNGGEVVMDWSPPAKFEEYRLLRKVGKGGMGVVYLAHDTLLDRLVAVKFIQPMGSHSRVRKSFLVEARAAARLQHPNVVSIYRVGELDDRPFIISEYVRGTSLHKVQRPMPWRQVLDIGIGLARGLAAAHRQGILHRDIKPANAILTEDGAVKLLDFGLAKFLEANEPIPDGLPTPGMLDGYSSSEGLVRVRMPSSSIPMALREGVVTAINEVSSDGASHGGGELVNDGHSKAGDDQAMAGHGPHSLAVGLTRMMVNSLTTVWGTPLYMAPELWEGKPATRRSDVYSLGVLLYELCAGRAPHADSLLADLRAAIVDRDAPLLGSVAGSSDADFTAIIDRSLRRDPDQRFASAEELREALEEITTTGTAAQIPQGNPYRGLLAFEAEHRALFFGRHTEIRTLCERLRSHSFVLVAGDSGVGKSSLCRAGVIPQVSDDAIGDERSWSVVGFMPGAHPCTELANALEPLFDESAEILAGAMQRNPHAFIRRMQTRLGADRGLLLFVDQLEELVTVSDRQEEELFAELMSHIAQQFGNLRLLATVRSDFLAKLATTPLLGDEVTQALYLLRPMQPDNIRAAIIGPARTKGVSFESDTLVDVLIDSTTRTEGGLPLLQFALAELWDARTTETTTISVQALRAIGGVEGALAGHADSVLLGLPLSQRRAARSILTALVTAEGTRTRRDENDLIAGDLDALAALDALVQGRLLVARESEDGSVYELAHEALISGWNTLRHWLDEDVESRAAKQRLEASAIEWERLGKVSDVLWSPRQVAEADVIDRGELGSRERSFLARSERAMKRRRYLRSALLLGSPLLLVMLYGFIQFKATRALDASVAEHVATGKANYVLARATLRELDDVEVEAFAAFDSQQSEAGEALWNRVEKLADKSDDLFREASQSFEVALTVNGKRSDVRDLLADILLERALLAERRHNDTLCDELIDRLMVHDASGERMQKWHASAHLRITSEPPGALVTLARYESDDQGAMYLTDSRELGITPIAVTELAQGSYMLTLTADNRVDIRYPVMLGRGENVDITVPIPLSSAIPKGFAFIPPGRFLFGSADQNMVRREFLNTVPIHPVLIDAYLIAKNETTYREWIEYLRSQKEHLRLGVAAGKGDLGGTLSLEEGSDGKWRLSLQLANSSHEAEEGEPIIYRHRKLRATQDWLELPVSGVSFQEASAYTQWLHRTGRVPNAHVCTEYEWERAARGADDRVFPHGNRVHLGEANYDDTYGQIPENMGPDQVGTYPSSRSPFNIDDMMGNIFEWTVSSVERDKVLIRGGAYFYDPTSAQLHNRTIINGDMKDPTIGFRVCASWNDSND